MELDNLGKLRDAQCDRCVLGCPSFLTAARTSSQAARTAFKSPSCSSILRISAASVVTAAASSMTAASFESLRSRNARMDGVIVSCRVAPESRSACATSWTNDPRSAVEVGWPTAPRV